MNNISVIKRDQAQYDASVEYIFKSLKIMEELNDSSGIANAYINMAVVYAIKQDFKLAEEYFNKAIIILEALGKVQLQHTITLNLAGVLSDNQEFKAALPYLNKARDYFEANGPPVELGRTHYIYGNIYLELNELDKSEGNYLIARGIFSDIGNIKRETGVLLKLSRVAEMRSELESSMEYAELSLQRAKVLGILNMELRSLEQLVRVNERLNNYEQAFALQKDANTIKDSLYSLEKDAQITELEQKYQSEVRERELKETKANLELQQLKLKRKENQERFLFGIVAAVFVILILLWYLYRNNKKSSKILEEKNKLIERSLADKEILLKEIHHRVKNNLQFLSSLFNLQSRHVEDPEARTIIQEGKNRIQSIALVHQKLYQEDDLTGVNMEDYLRHLTGHLQHSFRELKDQIQLKLNIKAVSIDIDTAMPIGLIVNELITNSYKYAFPDGKKGTISIDLSGEEEYCLTIKDDGVGIKEINENFGWQLIRSLVQKIGATIERHEAPGLHVEIKFTYPKETES